MGDGIEKELEGIDLGDLRLNRRSQEILKSLAVNPQASVNAASQKWSDTIAAYRFFNNPAVEPKQILLPHLQATKCRMNEHPVVLIIQDTTELDFSKHPPKDAKCLNKKERLGIYDHTQLAVTPDRLCLGIISVEEFDRTAQSLGKTVQRRSLPIEQKESFRWLTGYRLASQLGTENPTQQIVSISDREADIYDMFVEYQSNPTPADFIIRAKLERFALKTEPDSDSITYQKVRKQVAASEILTTRTIELSQTPKRKSRQATLEIRAIEVTVKPPRLRSELPSVTYNIVLAEEINGPKDGTDISWLLSTSLPIDTAENILLVLDYYAVRWTIEVYFRILKTGCRVEEIQLESLHRFKNCLAFYRIIAWRVLHLTYLNRECPELPCNVVFEDSEWKSVWKITTKNEVPKNPPTLAEFMRLLATLGGYNNRPSEPPPGPQAIWIALRRMSDFALVWKIFTSPD